MVLKNVNWMSTFAVGAALAVALTGTITAHAATAVHSAISQKSVKTAFESSSPSLKNNDIVPSDLSWGELILNYSKERAFATMKTFDGTAYFLSAMISGWDRRGYIPSSYNIGYNAPSTTTGVIFNRTTSSSVTWDASGEIQDTPTSGTQTAQLSETVL